MIHGAMYDMKDLTYDGGEEKKRKQKYHVLIYIAYSLAEHIQIIYIIIYYII